MQFSNFIGKLRCRLTLLINLRINGDAGDFVIHSPLAALLVFVFAIFLITFIAFLCGFINLLSASLHAF